jgi:hypothetical protein
VKAVRTRSDKTEIRYLRTTLRHAQSFIQGSHPAGERTAAEAERDRLAAVLGRILDRCTDGRPEADGASLAEWAAEIRAALPGGDPPPPAPGAANPEETKP